MHPAKNLTGSFSHFGFVPIGEGEFPPTFRERYAGHQGEMDGADVSRMKRGGSLKTWVLPHYF
jgi:hypothetical protein